MDIGIISARYAKALLRFAEENGEAEKVYGEMNALCASFLSVPRLQEAMQNPVLADEDKVKLLLAGASVEGGKPSGTLSRFAALVVRKSRADIMRFVAASYGTLYRKSRNIVEGTLVIPAQLDPETVARLKGLVESRTGSDVRFKVREEPAIMGGFVLEYDTYRMDASVRTQLQRLHRRLSK